MRRGFTLIEMLMVIGILVALISAALGSYSAMTRSAEKTRALDLVQQVALALTTMHDNENGHWPRAIARVGEKGGLLDEKISFLFVSSGTHYLALHSDNEKLLGYDRFGVLDPWGMTIVKRKGSKAVLKDIEDHRLWFAVDNDGDGIISEVSIGGESVDVRATAIVWCGGRDGKIEAYSKGVRGDDVYSWAIGQTKQVK